MDISKDKNLPFNIKHPEYNLIPRSSFKRLSFFKFGGMSNWPDYIEDPDKSAEKEYLYMVKKTVFGSYRFGILYFHQSKLFKSYYSYRVIIQCRYDKIEKVRNDDNNICFLCFNKGQKDYRDSNGKIMK